VLACLAGLSPAATAVAGPVLPCGVADAGGRTGFVANAHGGIDAVDLATGDLLWDADGAKRPALAEDDRLYAWAPVKSAGLRVLAFDRAKGGRPLLESEPASFPDWVNVEEGPGRSFTTRLAAGQGPADPRLGGAGLVLRRPSDAAGRDRGPALRGGPSSHRRGDGQGGDGPGREADSVAAPAEAA